MHSHGRCAGYYWHHYGVGERNENSRRVQWSGYAKFSVHMRGVADEILRLWAQNDTRKGKQE